MLTYPHLVRKLITGQPLMAKARLAAHRLKALKKPAKRFAWCIWTLSFCYSAGLLGAECLLPAKA